MAEYIEPYRVNDLAESAQEDLIPQSKALKSSV
jgi:hypothetical protein